LHANPLAGDRAGGDCLPGFGVRAGQDDRGGAEGGDGVMALAGVEGTVGGDSGDLLIGRDPVESFGRHRRVADVAGGELGSPDFQRSLVDPDTDLAPQGHARRWPEGMANAAPGVAVLARVPCAFALDLDPGAVDQQVPRAFRSAMRTLAVNAFWRRPRVRRLGTAQVRTDPSEKARDEPDRPAERHAERHLHRQAGLDGGLAAGEPATALARGLACRHILGRHISGQHISGSNRIVSGRSAGGSSSDGSGCWSVLAAQPPRGIHETTPLGRVV
jgi:hypothetical protein